MTTATTVTPATDAESARPLPRTAEEARARRAAGETWTNQQVRDYYNTENSRIPALNDGWRAQGMSAEDRARRAHELRHDMRMTSRAMMGDSGQVLELLIRDAVKYGDGEGPTFDQLVAIQQSRGRVGDASYEAIITGAPATSREYNERAARGDERPGVAVPDGVTIQGDVATVRAADGSDVEIRIRTEPGDSPPYSVRNPNGTYEIRFGAGLAPMLAASLVSIHLGDIRTEVRGDTGASAGMADPESSYRGGTVGRNNAHNVRDGVTESLPTIGNLFPPGAVRQLGPNLIEINIGGTLHQVRIQVANGSLPVATDVANFDMTTSPITVTVSGTINKEHVERALGHEISEIRSILQERAGGPVRSTTHNALGTDSTAMALSHDDMGKLGELRVLVNDLTTGGRTAGGTRAELVRLLGELGMLNTDGDAFNTDGLGNQRRRLMAAEGIDFARARRRARLRARDSAPQRPVTAIARRPPRSRARCRAWTSRPPTSGRCSVPISSPRSLEFGLSEETVIQYIVDNHNDRSQQRYVPDLEGLTRQHAGTLTGPDVLLIDMYTTKLFYKELNSRLSGPATSERAAALRLARLLNASITRLPRSRGTVYRSIRVRPRSSPISAPSTRRR